jgi:hypothetical protein
MKTYFYWNKIDCPLSTHKACHIRSLNQSIKPIAIPSSGQYTLETHPFKWQVSLCLLRNPNIEIVPGLFDWRKFTKTTNQYYCRHRYYFHLCWTKVARLWSLGVHTYPIALKELAGSLQCGSKNRERFPELKNPRRLRSKRLKVLYHHR